MRKTASLAFLFAALLAAVIAITFAPASRAAPESGPALWKIQKNKGQIWFFGSVHVLPKGQDWRTPALTAAMEAADAVVLEIPMADAAAMSMQVYVATNALSLTQTPLREQLPENEREAYDKAVRTAGLEPYQLNQMKPWFAAITMTMSLLQRSGFDPSNGVDQHIENEAKAKSKEMLYFETARQQIDFFITLPPDVQLEMLRDTVSEINENPNLVDSLVEAWRTSNVDEMGKLANDSYTSPELQKILLTDRNARWVEKIGDWMNDDKSYLIVVGAGHLAGSDSVIAMLRDKGVEVEGP